MKNFLKCLILILFIAHFPQEGIAKKEDVVAGKPTGFVDENGDLISEPDDAQTPATEDTLPQTLAEAKDEPAANRNVAKDIPVVGGTESVPLEEAMVGQDKNSDIARDANNLVADDISQDEIPPPPAEDEVPTPPTIPLMVEDETPPPPSSIDETPLPSASEVVEPTLAAEDQPIPTVEDGTSPPSPSEVVEPTLAADVPVVDMGTSSRDTSQPSEEQGAHERAHIQAVEQKSKQAAAQNEFQAKAIQQAQKRQREQHLAKQETTELQERERALHKQAYLPARSHVSSERAGLEQERMNPQVTEVHERSKEIAKADMKANMVQNVGHQDASAKKEGFSQRPEFAYGARKYHNPSSHKGDQEPSVFVADEHGNLIHKDELNSEEEKGEKENPVSVLGRNHHKP